MKHVRHFLCAGLLTTAFSACSCVLLLAAEPEAPAPEISLSLRGVAEDIVEQGEPLRIVIRLDAPSDTTDEIELAPARGAWTDAIAVELAPAGGGAVVVRAQPVGTTTMPHATVSATRIAGGLWRLPAETMRRVAPGAYVVRARLAIPSGRGWTGEVVSEETPLQVVAASDSAGRVAQRTINRAHDALLDGRTEDAARIVDAVLERAPDDEALLTVRAHIAERVGNLHAAMICLNRFLRVRTGIGPGQPSIELEELRDRILAARFADRELSAEPPAWSWPPAVVLAVPAHDLPASAQPAAVPIAAPATAVHQPATTPSSSSVSRPDPAAPTPQVASTSSNAGAGTVVPSTELSDATILVDANGQWAERAQASSEYGTPRYGAGQATGVPNIPLGLAGDNPDAWCPAEKNAGSAWLELAFANPTHATEVRVRQNNAPGAIAKIEAIDDTGTAHVWWEGVDPFVPPPVREIAWFAVRVPRTDYLVAKMKITLNLATVAGWKQIDAVQLVRASDIAAAE